MLILNVPQGQKVYIDNSIIFSNAKNTKSGSLINLERGETNVTEFIKRGRKLTINTSNGEPVHIQHVPSGRKTCTFGFSAEKHIEIDREVIHLKKQLENPCNA